MAPFDFTELRQRFGELTPTRVSAIGERFAGYSSDRTPIEVLILAPDIAARLDITAFENALSRAASVDAHRLIRPHAWGRSAGVPFVAFASPAMGAADRGLNARDVAIVGTYLARALSAAHGAGVVHGAITPGRVLRDPGTGECLLADFGLNAALVAGGIDIRDAATMLSDLPSPEQTSGDGIAEATDIYGLGAALYELLTGKPPHGGRMTSYVMASVLSESDASSSDATTDRVVDALVRAIESAPEDRWSSADAFAAELAAAAGIDEAGAPRNRRLGCGGVAAAIVVLASAALLASR